MALGPSASALAALSMVASTSSDSPPSGSDLKCFDAQVYARIARQTPTIIPDCGPDCITVSWPWILELNVERVLKGHVATGSITVLTVQHTWMRTDIPRRWLLRRNSIGAFNVLRGNAAHLTRCLRGTEPARPYIHPPTGKTLADLAREGEAHYGKQP